ncbi:MAG: hypothetical protein ACYCX4_13950 [Bacillota bacterium]
MAPSVPVLIANTEITAGDPLTKEMFREIKLPPAVFRKDMLSPSRTSQTRLRPMACHREMCCDFLE